MITIPESIFSQGRVMLNGKKIQARMRKKKISARELAEKMGMSYHGLLNCLAGIRGLRIKYLNDLSLALDIEGTILNYVLERGYRADLGGRHIKKRVVFVKSDLMKTA